MTRIQRLGEALWVVLAVFSAHPLASANDSLAETFQRGNEAYFSQDYERATQEYQRLLEAGVHDPDVYFNLATAHAQRADYGRAILYYERTLRLQPSDDEAARGITLAYEHIARRRADAQGEALLRPDPPVSEALVSSFTEDGLAWSWVMFSALFFSVWIGRRLVPIRREAARLGLGIAIPLFGFLSATSAAGLAIKAEWMHEGSTAVILAEETSVRSGADHRAQARAHVHEGDRVNLLRTSGEWTRVRLSDGVEGFIETSRVAPIRAVGER